MKSTIQLPGALWIFVLAIINTLPAVLMETYPNAVWVPLVIDVLLVAGKAIQVYMPKDNSTVQPAALDAPVDSQASTPDKKLVWFLLG